MTLRERLAEAMKEAMKGRDELRLSSIRLARSAVKNREIELRREIDDQGIIEVLGSLVKQRRESIRLYNDAQRADLAEKEERELAVLLDFLPRQLSRDELEEMVRKAVSDTGATGAADIGKVMKALAPHTTGRADGRTVSDLVRQNLS